MMNGTQRVQRVIAKFSNLASELDRGIAAIDEEIGLNAAIIEGLQIKNTALGDTGVTARNVAKNLRGIIEE